VRATEAQQVAARDEGAGQCAAAAAAVRAVQAAAWAAAVASDGQAARGGAAVAAAPPLAVRAGEEERSRGGRGGEVVPAAPAARGRHFHAHTPARLRCRWRVVPAGVRLLLGVGVRVHVVGAVAPARAAAPVRGVAVWRVGRVGLTPMLLLQLLLHVLLLLHLQHVLLLRAEGGRGAGVRRLTRAPRHAVDAAGAALPAVHPVE